MSERIERHQTTTNRPELSKARRFFGGVALLGAALFSADNAQSVHAKIPTNTIVNEDFGKRPGGKFAHHWIREGDVQYQGNLLEGDVLVGLRYSEQFGLENYGNVSARVLLDDKDRALKLLVTATEQPNLGNKEVIFPSFSIKFLKYANEKGGKTEEVGDFYFRFPAYEGEPFVERTFVVFETNENGVGTLIGGQEFVIPKGAHLMEISLNADGGFSDPEHDGNSNGRHFGTVKYTKVELVPAE